MAKLKHSQMRALDEIFGMQGGYVLDFSNSTMARFFSDEFQVDIYAERYADRGTSKANRLRAFIEKEPKKYVGHNPLAQLAMFFFMTIGITFMIVTGWALYAEGAGRGSFPDSVAGWVLGLVGNSMFLHTLHHLGMWFIVIFMIIHIYAAIREDIMSRQSMVSTMISGHRTFKDDRVD